jgi:hypothetical protein
VREIVEREIRELDSGLTQSTVDCFSPAAPVPERRIPKAG